ncbi:MAG: elongation factor G [Bacilli bacterium]|nr:elongation factor G [Bacilli bacterium]MDD4077459.1 elongation factor G [Bacilli bacterium]MDD4388476.1 elongation factor G [Bacilli bacterium]
MKEYKTNEIRNVAILGHLGSGKTTLGESVLYVAKAIEKKGEIEKKNTVGDYSIEEQNRLTTLTASLLPIEWANCKINFLDTPGSEELIGEMENALAVADAALLLIDATKGVEVGTERAWEELRKRQLPTIIFINKMDKENIKYQNVINSLKERLDSHIKEFTLPIFSNEVFVGYIDIINKNSYQNGTVGAIGADFKSQAEEMYNGLLENVAETSEELLEKFFSGEELTSEEIRMGLANAVTDGDIFPVICGSALQDEGIVPLLDSIITYLPYPSVGGLKQGIDPKTKEEISRKISHEEPLSAMIFKTNIDPFVGTISFFKLYSGSLKTGQEVYIPEIGETSKMPQLFFLRGKNQISADVVLAGDIACVAKVNEFATGITFCDKKSPIVYPKTEHPSPIIYVAIQPKKKQDEDKISSSLQRLNLEDTTFEIVRNPETAQLLIGGQGLTHIGYIIEKIRNMFKVEVEFFDQKIVYRETIRAKGEGHGRHKKQTGGAGQFGEVFIRFEPCSEDFVFEEVVVGGAVPKNYFPAVEKGLIETFERGPLAGFPVIGIKAVLYDGSYHPVDSNEISFKLAASLAFKNALEKLRPTILEPIIQLNVMVKDEFVGDIMGDLPKRRGRVLGMEQKHGFQEIIAEVPESEITKYAVDLKAMTQASGRFTRIFLRYEEVPEMLINKIIEEYKKQ